LDDFFIAMISLFYATKVLELVSNSNTERSYRRSLKIDANFFSIGSLSSEPSGILAIGTDSID
jgi:hypothetical protein